MFNNSPTGPTGIPPNSYIMLLPQLGGMAFSIANNAGWYDTLVFTKPGDTSAPLDISSINFHAELRTAVNDASNRLDMSTIDPPTKLVNGGGSGQLFFSVDVSFIVRLTPGQYVMDIIATDIVSGMVKSLCEVEPINVTVIQGVTR